MHPLMETSGVKLQTTEYASAEGAQHSQVIPGHLTRKPTSVNQEMPRKKKVTAGNENRIYLMVKLTLKQM